MSTAASFSEKDGDPRRRRLPIISECIITVMNLLVTVFHLLAPSFSMTISTGMIGALFGLMIPPAVLGYLLLGAMNLFIPQLDGKALYYIALPILLVYIIRVLILDDAHIRVPDVGSYRRPRNFIEKVTLEFWLTHFRYFPMTVSASASVKLPPSKQYIFAVHPHGIHCWPLNALAFKGSPFDVRFPDLVGEKLTGLAASVIFKIPVVRELFLSMGYIDADRKVASKALAKGRSLFICVGGEDESLRSCPGKDTVVLNDRKGFVRLALSYGCTIVPVFGLKLNDLYQTYDMGTLSFRQKFQKSSGIALPIFHGIWGTPLPYKIPMNIIIGEGIDTPPVSADKQGQKVDEELVDKYHEIYIKALKKLYDEHNDERDRQLEIL